MGNQQSQTFVAICLLELCDEVVPAARKGKRKANALRDRETPLELVRSWTDDMFRRQYRLSRHVFKDLLHRLHLAYPLSPLSRRMAINSSGSAVTMELKLLITLRMLAGASYLDMIWYGVDVDHVHGLFLDTVRKIECDLASHKG
jgi:hypothetical protein